MTLSHVLTADFAIEDEFVAELDIQTLEPGNLLQIIVCEDWPSQRILDPKTDEGQGKETYRAVNAEDFFTAIDSMVQARRAGDFWHTAEINSCFIDDTIAFGGPELAICLSFCDPDEHSRLELFPEYPGDYRSLKMAFFPGGDSPEEREEKLKKAEKDAPLFVGYFLFREVLALKKSLQSLWNPDGLW
jgi:hypothetical protein